jgi:ADP-ribose pyrophosphatase
MGTSCRGWVTPETDCSGPSDPVIQPERLSTTRVFSGRLLNVDRETIRNPRGEVVELEMIRHPGASAVVPLLDPDSEDPEVLVIRQFRHASGGMIWEIPAGVLDQGESPEACAARELLEETGARARQLDHLSSIYTTPGFTDELIHLFLATGLEITTPTHQADEFIEIEPRRMSRLLEMIRNGEIVDGKTVVALLFVAGFRLGL